MVKCKIIIKHICIRLIKRLVLVLLVAVMALYIYTSVQFNLKQHKYIPKPLTLVSETINLLVNYKDTGVGKQVNGINTGYAKDMGRTYTLVDINNGDAKNHVSTVQGTHRHEIVWYNLPGWVDIHRGNAAFGNQCSYDNCHMTGYRANLSDKSAIVFCLTGSLPYSLPVNQRSSDQIWVMFWLEPPSHLDMLRFGRLAYRHKTWRKSINWTMSYRTDSDIFLPYGALELNYNQPTKDYTVIFNKKNKFAAWVVSNCVAESRRLEYVNEMKDHGISVDIFGQCGSNGWVDRMADLKDAINKEYKFFLSFENSFCNDYVTEKFFRYYNLDVVLVVRGGANYSKLLPPKTFIDAGDFKSSYELSNYLKHVASHRTLYTNYLTEKDRYTSNEMLRMTNSFCRLCEKLNNLEENRRVISDIVPLLYDNQCRFPTDLNTYHQLMGFVTVSNIASLVMIVILVRYWSLRKRLS